MEQYKIKQAPNDVATILLNINSNDWNKAYEKYKNNLNCSQNLMREGELDWIAGVAIKRTYSANSKGTSPFKGQYIYFCSRNQI